MRERTDSERVEWLLHQNRLGHYMIAVTTRRDVDELMDEEERADAPAPGSEGTRDG